MPTNDAQNETTQPEQNPMEDAVRDALNPSPVNTSEQDTTSSATTDDQTRENVDASEETEHTESSDEQKSRPIETLDDARKVIDDLRKENARQRTTAKENAAAEARAEIARALAEALGVTTNDDSTDEQTLDPAEQVQTLTARVEQTTREHEQTRRELTIYRTAAKAGANPEALLDSRSFISRVETLDPGDEDAILKAIKDAVDSNAVFRAPQAGGASRVDHAPGGPVSTAPQNLHDAVAQALKS